MSEGYKKIITCPKCKQKLNMDKMEEQGYVENMGEVNVIWCYCDNQIIL